ncbi:MAG: prepilin-type N-terminal cleavage/methylation domain-containing protein [Armatimonadota bacterium]
MCKSKAFTLIELLVVIAIIAILAAILFPVFVKSRENANAMKCLAHGRQLGEAMMMYLDDYNGRFPGGTPADISARMQPFQNWKWTWQWKDHTWTFGPPNAMQLLFLPKYVKSKDIWVCPAPSGPYGMKYAYGYRCSWFFFGGPKGPSGATAGYPDTGFTYTEPPEMVGIGRVLTDVLGEDRAKYGRPGVASKKVFACCYALGPDVLIEMYAGGPVVTPYFPHGEGTIYVYMDGHARWQETGCGWAPVRYTNHNIDRPHKHGCGI